MRSTLKVLKVAHDKFTWSGGEMPRIGRYGGHNWQTLVFGSWMHEQYFRSVQVKASNRLESDNQESSNCHNHACDRTKLTV